MLFSPVRYVKPTVAGCSLWSGI